MSEFPFDNTDDFLAHAGFGLGSDYQSLTPLSEVRAGFSVQREYPHGGPYQPPRYRDGSPDVFALLMVVYEDPDSPDTTATAARAPVTLHAAPFSRSWARTPFYDALDESLPTTESIEASRRTREPLALSQKGQFWYNHNVDLFSNHDGDTFTGHQILDQIYDKHLSTTRGLGGLLLRSRMGVRRWTIGSLSTVLKAGHWSLAVFFGRLLAPKNEFIESLGGYSGVIPQCKVERSAMNGVPVATNSIVTFAGTVSALTGLFVLTSTPIPTWMTVSGVTAFALTVFGVWVVDYFGPKVVFLGMQVAARLRAYLFRTPLKLR